MGARADGAGSSARGGGVMTEFILNWISGPWAGLLIVALFASLGLLTAAYVAACNAVIWFISKVRS